MPSASDTAGAVVRCKNQTTRNPATQQLASTNHIKTAARPIPQQKCLTDVFRVAFVHVLGCQDLDEEL